MNAIVSTSYGFLKIIEKFWPFMTAMLAGLIGANLSVQSMFQWSPSFLTFQLGFALLTLVVPFVLASLSRAVNHELPALTGELASAPASESELDRKAPPRSPGISWLLVSGFVMLVAGSFSAEIFGIPWTGGVRRLFYAWTFCFLFLYGIAAWLYLVLMLIANRVSQIRVEADVFSWPKAALRDLVAVYMRNFLLGAALYVGAVVTVWISPGGAWIAQNTGIGRLWVFPPGAMVILFFLYFNFCFRRVLVGLRQSSEDRLTVIIESKFQDWCASQTEALAESIDALLRWRDMIRAEEIWPLNYKSILVTVVTLLLPTLKAVVDLL